MKYVETVVQDDATLRRVLSVLDGMAMKMEDGGRIEIADATTVLGFLKPAQDDYSGERNAEEEALVSGLELALKTKRARDFLDGSRQLSGLLHDYLAAEDQPAAAESPESQARPEILARLSRLERKYAPGRRRRSFWA